MEMSLGENIISLLSRGRKKEEKSSQKYKCFTHVVIDVSTHDSPVDFIQLGNFIITFQILNITLQSLQLVLQVF